MDSESEYDNELRPEYDLSQLQGGVRGKYVTRLGSSVTLDRSTRQESEKLHPLLKTAIACGAVPLATGTLIYLAWWFTRWDALPGFGLLNIFCGLVLSFVGVICLAGYLINERRSVPRASLVVQALLVSGLLLVNYPAAAFYALSAIDLMGRCTVHIANESDTTIESLILIGPGVKVEAGPVQPGGNTSRTLDFVGDGTLDFSAKQQNASFKGQLAGYVTGGIGGEIVVRVKPDGKFEVHDSGFVD